MVATPPLALEKHSALPLAKSDTAAYSAPARTGWARHTTMPSEKADKFGVKGRITDGAAGNRMRNGGIMKTAATNEKTTAILVQSLPGQPSVAELERQAAAG